jgi:small subunit ribosomal protein S23
MGRQTRPTRVFKTVQERIALAATKPAIPPWFDIVRSHPPSGILSRPAAVQLQEPNPWQRLPKNVYLPQRITYPEDKLRQTFYRDHPWELARPRVVVESDGLDADHFDWSKGLRQPGIILSGEKYSLSLVCSDCQLCWASAFAPGENSGS